MKNNKILIIMGLLFLLGFILIGCNNKDIEKETEVVQEEIQEPEDKTKPNNEEEIEAEELIKSAPDLDEIYKVGDISEIDEVVSYFDSKIQDALNEKITFDWIGRENVKNYRKRYFEEYIKLKTFYEEQYKLYGYSENPEETKGFILKKAYLEDLDSDGVEELILLIYHPVIEGEETTALVYSYDENNDKAIPIFKYTGGYYSPGDYGILLDLGLVQLETKDQLYITEDMNTMHTSETSIAYLDKIQGENEIIISPAVNKFANTDFETGNVLDNEFHVTNLFERYLGTISEPYSNLPDTNVGDSDEENYMVIRDVIYGENTVIFNSDRNVEEEEFIYNIDEDGNIVFDNYDYLKLNEEDLIEKLIN